MKRITAALLTALALSATVAWAHSGGTNSQGCHYNHKTGVYHWADSTLKCNDVLMRL